MLQSIDHINIVVRELDRMLTFYRDLLGMKVTMQARLEGAWIENVVGLRGVCAECVYLQPEGGPRLELLQYIAPRGGELAGLGAPNLPGLRHLAFRVSGIHEIAARLKQAGVQFVGEPVEVPLTTVSHVAGRKTLCYFHDPEGNLLELCEYRV